MCTSVKKKATTTCKNQILITLFTNTLFSFSKFILPGFSFKQSDKVLHNIIVRITVNKNTVKGNSYIFFFLKEKKSKVVCENKH